MMPTTKRRFATNVRCATNGRGGLSIIEVVILLGLMSTVTAGSFELVHLIRDSLQDSRQRDLIDRDLLSLDTAIRADAGAASSARVDDQTLIFDDSNGETLSRYDVTSGPLTGVTRRVEGVASRTYQTPPGYEVRFDVRLPVVTVTLENPGSVDSDTKMFQIITRCGGNDRSSLEKQ